jgi:hypothetical protein
MAHRAGLILFDLVGDDALARRVQIDMAHQAIWITIQNRHNDLVVQGSLAGVFFRIKGFLHRQATEATIRVYNWETKQDEVFVFSEDAPPLYVKLLLQD